MVVLFAQVAGNVKVNFTVEIVSSKPLGTQAEELSGAPGFILDTATAPIPVEQAHRYVSFGSI